MVRIAALDQPEDVGAIAGGDGLRVAVAVARSDAARLELADEPRARDLRAAAAFVAPLEVVGRERAHRRDESVLADESMVGACVAITDVAVAVAGHITIAITNVAVAVPHIAIAGARAGAARKEGRRRGGGERQGED
jgi:hypothetical protein